MSLDTVAIFWQDQDLDYGNVQGITCSTDRGPEQLFGELPTSNETDGRTIRHQPY